MSAPRSTSPKIPLSQLRLLPLIAGVAWFVTLLSLLIYWLAEGRPRYPGQSNPYVAFISDIGAFRLQPLFICGGTLTSVCLVATIIAVHYHYHYRYSSHISSDEATSRGQRSRYKKVFSISAVIFGVLAAPCQIALTVFDNHGQPRVHRVLLFLALGGTGLSAVCTAVVFWGEMFIGANGKKESDKRLTRSEKIRRRSVVVSNHFLATEIALGVAFTALLWKGWYRSGGVVEWVMAFVMTGWFCAFWGFLVGGDGVGEEERPLLR